MAATTTPTPSKTRWSKGNTYDRARRMLNHLRHWGDGTQAPCTWCGRMLRDMGDLASGAGHPDHLTEDHIVCHTHGGRYVQRNLVPACSTCNKSRGARTFHEWAALKGVDADAIIAHAESYSPPRKAR